MNMIDKKVPHQEFDKADKSEGEVVIDLTDEVIIKTEDDDAILELTDETDGDKLIKEKDTSAEFEDDIIVLENTRDEIEDNFSALAGDEDAEEP